MFVSHVYIIWLEDWAICGRNANHIQVNASGVRNAIVYLNFNAVYCKYPSYMHLR